MLRARVAVLALPVAVGLCVASAQTPDPDAAYLAKFFERYAEQSPIPELAAYAAPERFDQAWLGDNHVKAFAAPSNDQGRIAWGLAYRMMALNEMYRATGDVTYLEANRTAIEAVLAVRDDRAGKTLWTGATAKAWGCDKYAERGRAVFAVHTGVITYPIFDFLLLARSNGAFAAELGEDAARIARDAEEAIAFHDPQWRDGPGEGEGYYAGKDQENVCEGKPLPGNRLSAMGMALWTAGKLTGNPVHRERALAIGRYIKNRLTVDPDGAYFWPYWLSEAAVTELGSRTSVNGEDTSHAGLTVWLPLMLAVEGHVFSPEEAGRFAGTVLLGFGRREDGVLFGEITGIGHMSPAHVSLPARWLALSKYDPRVVERIVPYYLKFVQSPSPLDLALLIRHVRGG